MRRSIMIITGLTLFFMVLTVLYTLLMITEGNDNLFAPFYPVIFLTGFFIFLIAAFLIANAISKIFN